MNTRHRPHPAFIGRCLLVLACLGLSHALPAAAQSIDYETEAAIGDRLAVEAFRRYGMPVADPALQRYVNLVGTAVARNVVPPETPLYFVVVESPRFAAFACTGGIILATSGLVSLMADESELAGLLAHEIIHVHRKHLLRSFARAGGAEAGSAEEMVARFQEILFDRGLVPSLEHEADALALSAAYRTGYDPGGFIRLLERLRKREGGAGAGAGSWYATHPPLGTRIRKCRERMDRYPDAKELARVEERFQDHRRRLSGSEGESPARPTDE